MRRLWLLTALAVCACLGATALGVGPVRAGTFEQWVSSNDGLWGSDISCMVRTSSGTLLVGTGHEGVFATSDNGQHWHWSGQGLPDVGTEAEPSYRGILDLEGVQNSPSLVYLASEMGAYVSQDGGVTWQALGGALATIRVSCIAADPGPGTHVLAGTDDGVYASENAGATWAPCNDQMRRVHVTRLVFDAKMSGAVYACTTSGLYKSTDYGLSWVGLSSSLQGANVQCLEQDPRRPSILFSGTTLGIYRSYDAGSSWALLSPDAPAGSVLDISVDSFDVALIGALTKKGVLVSTDGGEHWTESYRTTSAVTCGIWNRLSTSPEVLLGTSAGPLFVSAGMGSLRVQDIGFLDVTAVAYDTNSAMRYAVRGSSLYRSDGVTAWQSIETNLGNARVYGLAIDRNEPRLMYAATEYGILRSTDGGVSWIQLAITPSDVRGRIQAVALDPTNGIDHVYAGNDYGLYRSDRGFRESWVDVGPANTGKVVGLAAYGGDRNLVYLLAAERLWKTTDYCKTWTVINDRVAPMNLTSLAVAENDPALLYAGSHDGVWRSADGGVTWSAMGTELRGLLVNSVVQGPQGQMLAGTNEGFFSGREAQDTTPPVVQVGQPHDGTLVEEATVTVSGTVTETESGLVSLLVGGKSVMAGTDGRFSTAIVLSEGLNSIAIEARDAAGNVGSQTVRVTFRKPVVTLTLQIGSTRLRRSNGSDVVLDAAPIILRSRTFLPIRAVVEVLGGQVGWDATARMARVEFGGHRVDLTLGSPWAIVDGKRTAIDAADTSVVPVIVAGRTLLPVRFVAEALGCTVTWDATTKTITVTSG